LEWNEALWGMNEKLHKKILKSDAMGCVGPFLREETVSCMQGNAILL